MLNRQGFHAAVFLKCKKELSKSSDKNMYICGLRAEKQ
jgi:hypothetical protein